MEVFCPGWKPCGVVCSLKERFISPGVKLRFFLSTSIGDFQVRCDFACYVRGLGYLVEMPGRLHQCACGVGVVEKSM